MDREMKTRRYAPEKPDREEECCFWNPKTKSCDLGPGNCYYLLPEKPPKPVHPCEGCPFAIPLPCIGYCIKELRRGVGNR